MPDEHVINAQSAHKATLRVRRGTVNTVHVTYTCGCGSVVTFDTTEDRTTCPGCHDVFVARVLIGRCWQVQE